MTLNYDQAIGTTLSAARSRLSEIQSGATLTDEDVDLVSTWAMAQRFELTDAESEILRQLRREIFERQSLREAAATLTLLAVDLEAELEEVSEQWQSRHSDEAVDNLRDRVRQLLEAVDQQSLRLFALTALGSEADQLSLRSLLAEGERAQLTLLKDIESFFPVRDWCRSLIKRYRPLDTMPQGLAMITEKFMLIDIMHFDFSGLSRRAIHHHMERTAERRSATIHLLFSSDSDDERESTEDSSDDLWITAAAQSDPLLPGEARRIDIPQYPYGQLSATADDEGVNLLFSASVRAVEPPAVDVIESSGQSARAPHWVKLPDQWAFTLGELVKWRGGLVKLRLDDDYDLEIRQ